MAEATYGQGQQPQSPPPRSNPLTAPLRAWGRVSGALVPVLAVLTALIITIPFMVLTGGRGDLSRGLGIAGTAYSALIEGSLGLAINDQLSPDDWRQITTLAETTGLTQRELRSLASAAEDLAAVDLAVVRRYGETLARFDALDAEALTELASRIATINDVRPETLSAMRPLLLELDEASRGDVRAVAEQFGTLELVDADARAAVEALAPVAADYSDDELLAYMQTINEYGLVTLLRTDAQLQVLDEFGIAPDDPVALDLAEIGALENGAEAAAELAATVERLDAAGVLDPAALSNQIDEVRELYSAGLLTDDDVAVALQNELPAAIDDHLIVRRPGNRLVIDNNPGLTGIIFDAQNTPDDPTDDRPETVYLQLGGSALLFFPANLEAMLVRAIPFIIAGLAVALGFKAGLFNIGAEGQLYAGATLAVFVAFSPIFDFPVFIRLPLVIVVGIIGGALWGMIPGVLKAFTGAHEVIVTIMLNFIAIRLVDWLIKSTDPLILLDPAASTPRTPFIAEAARLPTFDALAPIWFILVGAAVALVWLYNRRALLAQDSRYAIRPVVYGVLTVVGGYALAWLSVRGSLHLGFVLMLLAVWFTDWFLNRTTLGFELRTVGANPDAARYAGMSVRFNIILAMTLSGALAGLAGVGEIAGKEFAMQPDFFSGLGFDAIAVALLARTNPRNMIAAGLVWGSLLTAANLMQVRAEISIDLVKIIQALIIMFIAADAIIRYVWRVPKPSEKVATTTFSKGWGS